MQKRNKMTGRRVCAWCGKDMGEAPGIDGITHGMCKKCEMKETFKFRMKKIMKLFDRKKVKTEMKEKKHRDTLGLIADFVGITTSEEEAIRLVDEEMARGDCLPPIPKGDRDNIIKSLFIKKRQAWDLIHTNAT